jgi:hypothetical protein
MENAFCLPVRINKEVNLLLNATCTTLQCSKNFFTKLLLNPHEDISKFDVFILAIRKHFPNLNLLWKISETGY